MVLPIFKNKSQRSLTSLLLTSHRPELIHIITTNYSGGWGTKSLLVVHMCLTIIEKVYTADIKFISLQEKPKTWILLQVIC